jgi:hypothetical protein
VKKFLKLLRKKYKVKKFKIKFIKVNERKKDKRMFSSLFGGCGGFSRQSTPVYLNLYDLSDGLFMQISKPLVGTQLEAMWHSGIVAYGTVNHLP